MNSIYAISLVAILALGTGCQSAKEHANSLGNDGSERLTVGLVQKRIQTGMSQTAVIEALGSPNIVTKDARGKEAWVYDKIAREVSYSHDQGGVWFIVGAYGRDAGAQRSTQKTLTVVIKFNDSASVDDVTYHSSQF